MKTAEEILGNFGIGVNIEFNKYQFLYETLTKMIEQTQKEAYNQALEDNKGKILTITGEDNPYPLRAVLERLIWATEYLLHVKNYDGYQYEELGQCVRRAREIIESILKLKK